MKRKITVVVGGLALAALTGCGASDPVATPAETQTVTETVEVPGPTETVTEEVEVEVVKEVTPPSCLEAMDLAEDMALHAATFSEIAIRHLPLISKAYEAGVDLAPIGGIIKVLNETTAQMDSLNDEVEQTTNDFLAAKKECRSNG